MRPLFCLVLIAVLLSGLFMHWAVALVFTGLMCGLWALFGVERIVERDAPTHPRPHVETAYLVATLDIRATPPVVLTVQIYSAKAGHLSGVHDREMHVDVTSFSADTYAEALDRLRELAPIYYPWVKPFLDQ